MKIIDLKKICLRYAMFKMFLLVKSESVLSVLQYKKAGSDQFRNTESNSIVDSAEFCNIEFV